MSVQFVNSYMLLPTQYVVMTTGENDNVPITSSSVSFIPSANGDSITGMIPPDELTSGGLCYVSNADETGKSIIVKNNDSSSTDIYRFHLTHGSTTLTLANYEANLFYYVPTGVAATTGWYPYREGTFA